MKKPALRHDQHVRIHRNKGPSNVGIIVGYERQWSKHTRLFTVRFLNGRTHPFFPGDLKPITEEEYLLCAGLVALGVE
jgi:hypothetical protein